MTVIWQVMDGHMMVIRWSYNGRTMAYLFKTVVRLYMITYEYSRLNVRKTVVRLSFDRSWMVVRYVVCPLYDHCMTIIWPSYDHHTTIAWWSYNGRTMVVWWSYDGRMMADLFKTVVQLYMITYEYSRLNVRKTVVFLISYDLTLIKSGLSFDRWWMVIRPSYNHCTTIAWWSYDGHMMVVWWPIYLRQSYDYIW